MLTLLGRGPCARAHDHWRTASTERTAVIHVPRRHGTLALACWIPAHAPLPSHRKSGRAETAKCFSASNSGVAPVSMPVGEGSATGTGPTSGNRMCYRQSTGSASLRVVERATEVERLACFFIRQHLRKSDHLELSCRRGRRETKRRPCGAGRPRGVKLTQTTMLLTGCPII